MLGAVVSRRYRRRDSVRRYGGISAAAHCAGPGSCSCFPPLLVNYFGQGALLLGNPDALENPFLFAEPRMGVSTRWSFWASIATIIASQAVISGRVSRLPAKRSSSATCRELEVRPQPPKPRSARYMCRRSTGGCWVAVIILVLMFQTSDKSRRRLRPSAVRRHDGDHPPCSPSSTCEGRGWSLGGRCSTLFGFFPPWSI